MGEDEFGSKCGCWRLTASTYVFWTFQSNNLIYVNLSGIGIHAAIKWSMTAVSLFDFRRKKLIFGIWNCSLIFNIHSFVPNPCLRILNWI